MSKVIEAVSDYNNYVESEWNLALESPERAEAMLRAAHNITAHRILDIGCGAGQEMLPFVQRGAMGVGIDLMPEVGQVGRRLYAQRGLAEKINFVRASGHHLPFESETFDVLICRIALMYMNNKLALAEMARVLRSGGVFFLKYHAASYYWQKMRDGVASGNFLSSVHAARVLYAGNIYRLTGKQPFNKLTAGGEVFQSKSLLEREMESLNLKIIGEMPDTNPQTPSFIITKNG